MLKALVVEGVMTQRVNGDSEYFCSVIWAEFKVWYPVVQGNEEESG